jgi:phosphate transport system substrate-binding protein
MILRRAIFTAIFSFSSLHSSFAFDFGFSAKKRDYIHLVGSSTLSPLMASVSEEFSRNQALKNSPIQTPIVESTGSVAGFKLFCAGTGFKYPDFVNASRAIDKKEIENCYKNGVSHVVEIKIGYDGIVIANAKGSRKLNLTKKQIFLALAEKVYDSKTHKIISNPYKKWNEIDPRLPNSEIVFYGPPLTSGTRDVLSDMIMESSCLEQEEFLKFYKTHDELKTQCHKIRNDGVFIASGENDDNIVRALKNNPAALGVFGFNFLVVNPSKIQPIKVDGIAPSYSSIASKKYNLSRPLFVYFKKDNFDLIPEMKDFVQELISPETIGEKGYLSHSGLVPLSNLELLQIRQEILLQIK